MREALKLTLILLAVIGLWRLGRSFPAERLADWKEEAPAWAFFGMLSLSSLVGIPSTPFLIMAGATYGPAISILGAALSLTATLVASHLLAQSGLRPLLEKILRRDPHLPEFAHDHGLRFTLLVRLLPGVPTAAKNYLISLAGVPFSMQMAVSLPFSLLYALPLILLGDSALDRDPLPLAAALILLISLTLLARFFQMRVRKSTRGKPEVAPDCPQ
jgi:uncharacterized membrane protein YdjX (TVP38/TMEM64 family)